MELRKQDNNIETRFFTAPETRAKVVNEETRTIRGYGIVFNSESVDLRANGRVFREVIRPEAAQGVDFSRVLSMHNHKSERLLGNTQSGTMRTGIDNAGVWYEVDVPNSPTGEDVYVSVSRGDMQGSSFQFDIPQNGDRWSVKDGKAFREVLKFGNVYEMGPVSEPAYPDTTIAARSLEMLESLDLEKRDDSKELMAYIVSNMADFIREANWVIRYCGRNGELAEEYAKADSTNSAIYMLLKDQCQSTVQSLKAIIETEAQIISIANGNRNGEKSHEKRDEEALFGMASIINDQEIEAMQMANV